MPANLDSQWIDCGTVNSLTSFSCSGTNAGGGTIDALRLDGRILVDGPAVLQNWSIMLIMVQMVV